MYTMYNMVITLYNIYYSQRKTSRLELLRRSRMKIYNIVTRPRDIYNNNNNNISIIFVIIPHIVHGNRKYL